MESDIKTLLRLGEDSLCEFKAMRISGKNVAVPDMKDVADEISAAANAAGATFLFGVNDKTHNVDGIPEDKLEIAEAWLRNICNDSVKPAIPATIRKVLVCDADGKERFIVRLDVPKSLFVHEGPHGYFYRIGSSKRKMPPEMLARLFQQRSQTRLIMSASSRLSGSSPTYRLLGDSELLLTIYSVPIENRERLQEMVTTQVAAKTHPSNHPSSGKNTQAAAKNRPSDRPSSDRTTQVEIKQGRISDSVIRLLRIISGEMSVDQLRNEIGVADRRDFSRRYLSPALKSGYVEMTQPNSPRSPTQKYRLTGKGEEVRSCADDGMEIEGLCVRT
jgi:predicted HTH transcriptional regulator